MVCRATSIKKSLSAFSLPSAVAALGLTSLLFAALASVYLYSARSFMGLGNYMDMDSNARLALDIITADIRQADQLTSYSSNTVSFQLGSNSLTYSLNTAQRTLNRQYASATRTVLTDCDDVHFDVFQRNPTNGVYDYFPDSGSPTNTKLVEVTVLCTRSIFGKKANSTTVQSARIVMRNQR